MYYTTTHDIIRHVDAPNIAEYRAESLDEVMPGWEYDEMMGEDGGRYVSAADFPIYDASADDGLVSDDEWAAWAETMYCDPAERDLG